MDKDVAEVGNNLSTERKGKLLVALLCLLLSVVAVVPFFYLGQPDTSEDVDASTIQLGMPTTHDMFLHYDQMKSFHNGLKAGEIYPRWEEETNRGFGAPTTCYYPPGIYYITSLFYWLSGDWVRALLDAQLLMMIASAAAMFVYARRFMARGPALIAMAAYIFFPYHLIDQYQRGAIAELLAFVWMPLVLLFVENLMSVPADEASPRVELSSWRSHLTNAAGLALAYGLFLWSHPSTAYQFSLSIVVFLAVIALMRKEWKGLLRVGAGLIGGAALSAAYMLPAALEQNFIRNEVVGETWPYHSTYVFVHDLYGGTRHQDFFARIDGIWALGTVAIIILALALLAQQRKSAAPQVNLRVRIAAWAAVGLFVSFMMTRYSEPIGRLIPKIEIGVFTWRMLSMTSLVVALLAGACAETARVAKSLERKDRIAMTGLAWLVTAGGVVFSVVYVAWPAAHETFFEPESEHYNAVMLPRTAVEDPDDLPDDVPKAELESDNGQVVVEEWKPQHRVIAVKLSADDRLLLRLFNFPGWRAKIDGSPAAITTGEELGDVEIDVPAGEHRVVVDFGNTPARRAGSIATIATTALIMIAFAAGFAGRRSGPGPRGEVAAG